MKETKVYVDELPKSCRDCPCMNSNCFCKLYYMQNQNGNVLDCEDCRKKIHEDCPLIDIKTHNRELVKEVCEKVIKFINELAWQDIQYDAFQSTIGEFSGSTSAIPRYAKKYFELWKYMFGEDLNKKE